MAALRRRTLMPGEGASSPRDPWFCSPTSACTRTPRCVRGVRAAAVAACDKELPILPVWQNYPRPFEFLPERWAAAAPASIRPTRPTSLIFNAFGSGSCKFYGAALRMVTSSSSCDPAIVRWRAQLRGATHGRHPSQGVHRPPCPGEAGSGWRLSWARGTVKGHCRAAPGLTLAQNFEGIALSADCPPVVPTALVTLQARDGPIIDAAVRTRSEAS